MNPSPLGVGIVGAGPAVQAIHLPMLSTLADRLRVAHVMDVDERLADEVAARVGARASGSLEALLDDEDVAVIAVCSPNRFHAEHVIAAARAGKEAILCEKPLAIDLDEALRIAAAIEKSATPVVVGTMHAHDPAWVAAYPHLTELQEDAFLIRSTLLLPANEEFIELATDMDVSAPMATVPAGGSASARPSGVRDGILRLATHAFPQIRSFLNQEVVVSMAQFVDPFGYQLVLTGADQTVELLAMMGGDWQPDWKLEVWSPEAHLVVAYPPSYVRSGSATVCLQTTDSERSWWFPYGGYQAEWLHLADVVHGQAELRIPIATVVEDLRFALDVAAQADVLIRGR
jgi:myo-inositol 2-dehydrogenase / D-chiro-inositol 1-dehydrogenase